jgi:ATP-dependent Clp protease ATP-binding subunit ClpB
MPDSQSRKVDFKVNIRPLLPIFFLYISYDNLRQNTIICLTSNLQVGSDILARPSACNSETGFINLEAKSEVLEHTSEYFPPELLNLNRLDSMLMFNKLSRISILKVVSLRLDDVSKRLKNRRCQ